MTSTHLKIGAGATVVMRESQWRALLARTTGHVTIAANAKVIVVPETAPDGSATVWERSRVGA